MRWEGTALLMLDQRLLPLNEAWIRATTWKQVHGLIRDMAVRGAPAIGIAAAYGAALGSLAGDKRDDVLDGLATARPTAVNLFWALNRIRALGTWEPNAVTQEAIRIEEEDLESNLAIGEAGAALLPVDSRVLTVCNTGSLATAGHGTALGIVRSALAKGKLQLLYSCETRPRQQGLRLTAWECMKESIPFVSIADGAAASLMAAGRVDAVIVGADRIAANGDTANKIGTYGLAVLAKAHSIPFYVAAPFSTIDPKTPNGGGIEIEERGPDELTEIEGIRIAPKGCPVFNPAFDVTPAAFITAIITERGVSRPPFQF